MVAVFHSEKAESEADADDSHVFHTGIGKQTFEITLGESEKNTAERSDESENEKSPAENAERAVGIDQHSQNAVETEIDHGCRHYR